jgi:hypothetical protein
MPFRIDGASRIAARASAPVRPIGKQPPSIKCAQRRAESR